MNFAGILDPALVDRLAGCAPAGIDVYALAANAMDMTQRRARSARPVQNPNGLLVSMYKKALGELQTQERLTREERARELTRYGELYVQLFGLIATKRPSPAEIAGTLEIMRSAGYPQLNPHAIKRLRELGARWPAGP
jgi:hypothetical protein